MQFAKQFHMIKAILNWVIWLDGSVKSFIFHNSIYLRQDR